ncbi:MAG: hypothetical protein LRY27_02700 [Chitinophagales bacterium]|nr:hypothetical protein [Chitinophagales bacterium]
MCKQKVALAQDIFINLSNQNPVSWSTKFNDSVIDVRPLLACLYMKKDIEKVNQTIMRFKAWGTTGTSSIVNKKGDYDFTEILWVYLLSEFQNQPNLLYPETALHIANELIIDNGSKSALKAPHTLGLIRETENHILMKEGSRYLKNQYLYSLTNEAKYNNAQNGMDAFMLHHLKEMEQTGFFEFNANPYASYTLDALYVLYAQINHTEIKESIARILDTEHWIYALGSYNFKRFAPFRRRLEREKETGLFADRQELFVKVVLYKMQHKPITKENLSCCDNRVIIPLMSSYTLPKQVAVTLEEKSKTYYAKIGHGLKASPEIYYGTKDCLLSAGGLRYGKKSQIVPRATVLFLDDKATDLSQCFHIKGKGVLNKWNNTGVYQNLAIGKQAVFIPDNFKLIAEVNNWKLYRLPINEALYKVLCVYNDTDFGLMYISSSNNEAKAIMNINNDEKRIKKQFTFANNEKVQYNVNTRKRWVVSSINGTKTKRKFKKWNRLNVDFRANY